MHGSSSHSSNNVGVTSKWNCNPNAEPKRNAWFLVFSLRASGVAPSGSVTTSLCQCSTSSVLFHMEKKSCLSMRLIGANPISGASPLLSFAPSAVAMI